MVVGGWLSSGRYLEVVGGGWRSSGRILEVVGGPLDVF